MSTKLSQCQQITVDFAKSILYGESKKTTIFALVVSSGLSCYLGFRKWKSMKKEQQAKLERPSRLVIITGCDSGLGLSMAYWATKLGYHVIAGCFNPQGEGANYLRKEFQGSPSFHILGLDLRDDKSIEEFREGCERILQANGDRTKLWGIISNAAVMVMGEFLWQKQDHWERQMNVNFWGNLKLTSAFKELLLERKCRLIFTTSDCARYSLPTLSTYCASKAALQVWAESFRMEVSKYGVTVTTYDPGNFPLQSQLLAAVASQIEEMVKTLSPQDKIFYGKLVDDFLKEKRRFASAVPGTVKHMDDERRRNGFVYLLEGDLTNVIKFQQDGFCLTKAVRDFLPTRWADYLLCKFLYNIPEWSPREYVR